MTRQTPAIVKVVMAKPTLKLALCEACTCLLHVKSQSPIAMLGSSPACQLPLLSSSCGPLQSFSC